MNELYQMAAQLYANSLRAMEQRSSSFLVLQSILAGGFAVLLKYFQSTSDINSFLPTLGITLVGLVTSGVFLKAHRVTSRDVCYWRAYMKLLETKDTSKNIPLWKQPWHLLYKYAEEWQDKGHFSYYYALQRLPGPLLWLGFPVIFLTAWSIAILWVINFLEYSRFIRIEQFWIVVAISCGIAGRVTWCKWRKSKDDTYNQLEDTIEKSKTGETKPN